MVIGAVAGFDVAWAGGHYWESPWLMAWASALYGAGVTAFSAQEETGRGRGALVLGWMFMAPALVCSAIVLFLEFIFNFGPGHPIDVGALAVLVFGVFLLCVLWVRLLLLSFELARTETPFIARRLVLTGVQGYCYLDAAILSLGVGWPAAPWAVALILFIYPGRYLRQWLEQKEA
jgi:hypothetical protein